MLIRNNPLIKHELFEASTISCTFEKPQYGTEISFCAVTGDGRRRGAYDSASVHIIIALSHGPADVDIRPVP